MLEHLPFAFVDGIKKGAATVAVEALGKDGTVLAQKWADVRVEYEPVRIRFTEPCYKDCVFDTMKLTKVAGYVVLEETAGAPLKIRLTGPETDETREIAASAKTVRKPMCAGSAFAPVCANVAFTRAAPSLIVQCVTTRKVVPATA